MEERILSLRKLLDLSQKDFASKISITQAALSQIESGKTTLSISTVYNLLKAFDIRPDWLLFGQGEIFSHQRIEIAKGTPPNGSPGNERHLISFVDKSAEAGYPKNCADDAFINALGVYRIPGYDEGNFRMFNINGDSMTPSLHEGEIVITQAVDKFDNLHDNRLCVVVTQDGIVAKRVYQDKRRMLLLKSDNPKYKSYKIAYKDVIEIWEIKGKISSEFLRANSQSYNETDNSIASRLEELEKTVAILKASMQTDGPTSAGGQNSYYEKETN